MTDARIAVGAPEGSPTIVVDGLRLAYSDTGSGLPLVSFHATGHGARDFQGLPSILSRQVRIIAVDWPCQGRSADDEVTASAARYSELIAGIFEQLELDRAILLGNSIGGAAAIQFAARAPEKVVGLVLANPGGLIPISGTVRKFCGMMEKFFKAGSKRRRWFGPAFALYYRTVLQKGPIAEHRQRIVAAGYDHAPVLAQAWRSFANPEADLRSLAPTISCPVLFAWARHDKAISYRQCRPVIETFPNAETVLFNGGHCAFLEDAAAFGQTLDTFLEKLGAPLAADPAQAAAEAL